MKIVDCDQGSDEWFSIREKRMTGSHAQAIAANGKGLQTYIAGLMQEYYSSAEPVRYQSKSMERGVLLEDSAIFAYESETGNTVNKIGFVINNDCSGVSPDGFVNDAGLVEIKCLEDKAYFQYLLTEKIDTGYQWQMQMQMMVCDRLWCDYVVYNPNFKKSLIVQRVFPDLSQQDKIKKGLVSGLAQIKKIEQKIKEKLCYHE